MTECIKPRRAPVLVSTLVLILAAGLTDWLGGPLAVVAVFDSLAVVPIVWLTMFEGMRLHSWSSLFPCLLVVSSAILISPADARWWVAVAAALTCLISGSTYMLANRREDKVDLDRHVR